MNPLRTCELTGACTVFQNIPLAAARVKDFRPHACMKRACHIDSSVWVKLFIKFSSESDTGRAKEYEMKESEENLCFPHSDFSSFFVCFIL